MKGWYLRIRQQQLTFTVMLLIGRLLPMFISSCMRYFLLAWLHIGVFGCYSNGHQKRDTIRDTYTIYGAVSLIFEKR